jgi:hypothetical protein
VPGFLPRLLYASVNRMKTLRVAVIITALAGAVVVTDAYVARQDRPTALRTVVTEYVQAACRDLRFRHVEFQSSQPKDWLDLSSSATPCLSTP